MSKVSDKKKKMANKMSRKPTIEGDEEDGALTSFNAKDIAKEKKNRKERHTNEPKSAWLT